MPGAFLLVCLALVAGIAVLDWLFADHHRHR